MRINRVAVFAPIAMLCATLFALQSNALEDPTKPPASAASESANLSLDELKKANALFDQLAAAPDLATRAKFAEQMTAMMIADPANAVLWEVWLNNKRINAADNKLLCEALPQHIALRAALIGQFALDVGAFAEQQKIDPEDPDEDPDEEETQRLADAKKQQENDFEMLSKIQFEFLADGSVRSLAQIENPPELKLQYAHAGRFTIICAGKNDNAPLYLRGEYSGGQLWLKFPIDLPMIACPLKFKRLNETPRHLLAAKLEPMLKSLDKALPTPKFAGEYATADSDETIQIGADGRLKIVSPNMRGCDSLATGHAITSTDTTVEFKCILDFRATNSNPQQKEDPLDITTLKFRRMGQALIMEVKDEDGELHSSTWVKKEKE